MNESMDYSYLVGTEVEPFDPGNEDSQKLKLALRKQKIISEETSRLKKVLKKIRAKEPKERKLYRELRQLEQDPFIQFYLKLYRQQCGKKTIAEITQEVMEKWNKLRKKPKVINRKKPASGVKSYGVALGLGLYGQGIDVAPNEDNKFKLALIKNEVVTQEIMRLVNYVKKLHKEKKYCSPFIKMYLKVFREMCGKFSGQEIKNEAMKRWHKTTQTGGPITGDKKMRKTGRRGKNRPSRARENCKLARRCSFKRQRKRGRPSKAPERCQMHRFKCCNVRVHHHCQKCEK